MFFHTLCVGLNWKMAAAAGSKPWNIFSSFAAPQTLSIPSLLGDMCVAMGFDGHVDIKRWPQREKKKPFFPSRVGSREMKAKEGRQEE
jgi:hypothetical protein